MISIPPKYAGRAAVSPKEAADIAGITRSTFYRHHYPYVRSGRIQNLHIGGCLRIIVASYLTFLEQEANDGPRA